MEKYARAYSTLRQISADVPSDNRGFFHIAGYHGWPDYYCWHHLTRERLPNTRPLRLFFPWHRAYLYEIEQRLQDIVSNVTIPWWDWSSDVSHNEGLPKLFTQPKIGNMVNPFISTELPPDIPRNQLPAGSPNPPRTWRNTRPRRLLPTRDKVEFGLNKRDFEDAELYIEDIHDDIHIWVGGTMSVIGTAAYDMVFYSHHCMIDRIWYLWQKRHGNASGLEDILNEPLEPFSFTVREVLDIHQLGYDYGVRSVEIDI